MFIDQMGLELLKKNLYKNFVLHMSHLVDNDLITTEIHMKIIIKLQRVLANYTETQEKMQKEHEQQNEYWKTVGLAKHKKQLLLQKTGIDSKICAKEASHASGGIKTKEDKSTKKESGNKPSRILPKRKDTGSCATKSAAIPSPIAGPSNTRRHSLLATLTKDPPVEIESKRRSLNLRSM